MSRPPTFTELVDWVERRSAPAREQVIADHVALDPEAARTVEWVDGFLRAARLMPLVTPPPELRARLLDLFDAPGNLAANPSWVKAALLYDTAAYGMAGVRLTPEGGERHLAFETDAGRFVIEVRPTGIEGEVDLAGLLLLDGAAVTPEISVLAEGTVRGQVSPDPHGAFELKGVPVGVDELRISTGTGQITARLDLILP